MTTRKNASGDERPRGDFASQAQQPHASTLQELTQFVLQNKKWWLTPIVVLLLMASVLLILGGTAAAPFIYTLF